MCINLASTKDRLSDIEYFENLVWLEIETVFLFVPALTFSYIALDMSSTPSVNTLETFNTYQYRIICK